MGRRESDRVFDSVQQRREQQQPQDVRGYVCVFGINTDARSLGCGQDPFSL